MQSGICCNCSSDNAWDLAYAAQKSEVAAIMQRLDTMAVQQMQHLNQRMDVIEQRMEQKVDGLEQVSALTCWSYCNAPVMRLPRSIEVLYEFC